MYYFLLLIPVIAVIVYFYIKNKKVEQALIEQTYEIFNAYGELPLDRSSFIMGNQTYKVVFLKVPRGSELIINSPRIWEIKSGSGSRLLDQSYLSKYEETKIVVVYPELQPIKRYINENEMVFVKKTKFNNMYVIQISELENLLKEVLS